MQLQKYRRAGLNLTMDSCVYCVMTATVIDSHGHELHTFTAVRRCIVQLSLQPFVVQ